MLNTTAAVLSLLHTAVLWLLKILNFELSKYQKKLKQHIFEKCDTELLNAFSAHTMISWLHLRIALIGLSMQERVPGKKLRYEVFAT